MAAPTMRKKEVHKSMDLSYTEFKFNIIFSMLNMTGFEFGFGLRRRWAISIYRYNDRATATNWMSLHSKIQTAYQISSISSYRYVKSS